MKNIVPLMAVTLIASSIFFINTAMAGNISDRQDLQQRRIQQGVKNGEITKNEYRHLQKEQARIQRSKQKAWSDGRLTKKERLKLEHQQDNASHHIYRAKHNPTDRK